MEQIFDRNGGTVGWLTVFTVLVCCTFSAFGQVLETESAYLPDKHSFGTMASFEYQFSADGKGMAVPLELSYSILDNLEILVQPTIFAAVFPSNGERVNGLGDIEASLTCNFNHEKIYLPAFSFAGEVKLPTARNILIGTGKTDWTLYGIATKNFGPVEIDGNVTYTFMGSPEGVHLDNTVGGSLAAEWEVTPVLRLLGEAFANSAALPESASTDAESKITPEAGSAEFFGTVGAAYQLNSKLEVSVGINYGSSNSILLIAGVAMDW
ncbi:MAG: hypothetical protein PHF33_01440 [Candidatus Delongbacteria bacterium]|nr:hypothetical protein [Candidatus Delongbacteria bacterium]MDD4204491.1 hypothetical protein [Candidatus Delongbacteria bacterium]